MGCEITMCAISFLLHVSRVDIQRPRAYSGYGIKMSCNNLLVYILH